MRIFVNFFILCDLFQTKKNKHEKIKLMDLDLYESCPFYMYLSNAFL